MRSLGRSSSATLAAVFAAAASLPSLHQAPAPALVIACAGDSLMRPMPFHFKSLAAASGLRLEILEWAQGGLNSETFLPFFRRLGPERIGVACDAILIQLGTNDALPILERRWGEVEFRDRIRAILALLKARPGSARSRPLVFLATVPLFCDRPESAGKNRIVREIINPVLRVIAREEQAVLVDGASILDRRPALLDPDCVHPTSQGEQALAINWLDALRRHFPEAVSRLPHGGIQ